MMEIFVCVCVCASATGSSAKLEDSGHKYLPEIGKKQLYFFGFPLVKKTCLRRRAVAVGPRLAEVRAGRVAAALLAARAVAVHACLRQPLAQPLHL